MGSILEETHHYLYYTYQKSELALVQHVSHEKKELECLLAERAPNLLTPRWSDSLTQTDHYAAFENDFISVCLNECYASFVRYHLLRGRTHNGAYESFNGWKLRGMMKSLLHKGVKATARRASRMILLPKTTMPSRQRFEGIVHYIGYNLGEALYHSNPGVSGLQEWESLLFNQGLSEKEKLDTVILTCRKHMPPITYQRQIYW